MSGVALVLWSIYCFAAGAVMEYAERALAILDEAHRADAYKHGDGLVVIPDTPGGSA